MSMWLWVVISAFAASFIAGFPVYQLLVRYGIVDVPNSRSSHNYPTVCGGGIGVIVVMVIIGSILCYKMSSTEGAIILCCVSFLAAISFMDDLYNLHSGFRLACHSLVAIIGFTYLTIYHPISPTFSIQNNTITSILVFLVTILVISGYTNAFNFMDGINGIASVQAIITGTGSALIIGINYDDWNSLPLLLNLLIAGCALGFLPQNFPTARMFLGDVGSATFGYFLAILGYWAVLMYGITILLPLLLLHSNFILDTGITLVRRIFLSQKWYQAHHEHFYQKLIRAGKSHTQVTLTEAALQIGVVLLLLHFPNYSNEKQIFIGLLIIGVWLSFFFYAEKLFKTAVVGK